MEDFCLCCFVIFLREKNAFSKVSQISFYWLIPNKSYVSFENNVFVNYFCRYLISDLTVSLDYLHYLNYLSPALRDLPEDL